MLLSRVLEIKFEVCQHCFVLSRVYVMKFGYVIPQTSLHEHGTITKNTADTPQTSLHKHGQ
jgi:ABC-type proline/glycine betaine transport system ATPase subunit